MACTSRRRSSSWKLSQVGNATTQPPPLLATPARSFASGHSLSCVPRIALLLSTLSCCLLQATHQGSQVTQRSHAQQRAGTTIGRSIRGRCGHGKRSFCRNERRTPGGGKVLPAAIRQFDHPLPSLAATVAPYHGDAAAGEGVTGIFDYGIAQ